MAQPEAGQTTSPLSWAAIQQIETACDQFEAAWQSGPPPRIEDYLTDAAGTARAAALRELVAVDFAYRSQRGDRPTPEFYTERFPEDATIVSELIAELRGHVVPEPTRNNTCADADTLAGEISTVESASLRGQATPADRGQSKHGDSTEANLNRTEADSSGFDAASAAAVDAIRKLLTAPANPNELGCLGRYRVLGLLGAGGMGYVLKAFDPEMERAVALKVIAPRLMSDARAAVRFDREVRALARLRHPNIVTAYHADSAGAVRFLVMEFVEGENLGQRVKRLGRLDLHDAARIIGEVAVGLEHAHEQGMVHRDLKPSNLMLTKDGHVKILDLGLSRLSVVPATKPDLTDAQFPLGTTDYMAPEQVADPHAVDLRADMYSLGATMYQLVTGQVPFPTGPALERLVARRWNDPQPVRELRPDAPDELSEIISRMMARDRTNRFQSAAEVAAALLPLATRLEAPPAVSDALTSRRGEWRPETPQPAMKPLRRLLVAAAIIACLGVAAFQVVRVATDQGDIVLEVNDINPQVVIALEKGSVKIRDRKTDREYVLRIGKRRLPTGDYELKVAESDAGLEFEATTFLIKRGAEFVLRARFEEKKTGGLVTSSDAPERGPLPDVDDAWVARVARLSADDQITAVKEKLRELNPEFDGQIGVETQFAEVTLVQFSIRNVTNISPLRALKHLRGLVLTEGVALSDLSPLRGMKLERLEIDWSQVRDLSPL